MTPADKNDERKSESAQALCPHCIEPIGPLDHFCPHCLKPISAHAATDPLGSVFAQGHVYHNATGGSDRPRLTAVIGMWLIFAPQCFVLLGIFAGNVMEVLPGHRGTLDASSVPGFVFSLAITALYVAILWKVTSRYVRSRSSNGSTPATGTAA